MTDMIEVSDRYWVGSIEMHEKTSETGMIVCPITDMLEMGLNDK